MFSKNKRFTDYTLEMLRKAGWFPGRNIMAEVKLPYDFDLFPAAVSVLSEFSYLTVGENGPGLECVKTSITFDPQIANGESRRFIEVGGFWESKFYPLGEIYDGNAFLAIDEKGRVFLLMDDLMFVANDFDTALENLLVGRKVFLIDEETGEMIPCP